VQATTNNPFRVKIVSLPAGDAALPQFDPSRDYAWTIVSCSGGIFNFDPAAFSIDVAEFAVPFTGAFGVGTNNSGLALTYSGRLSAPEILSCVATPPGGFELKLLGLRGQSYRILTTPDFSLPLENWQVLTNGRFASGTNTFTDAGPSLPQRFYRVVSP
jgi:hypothetical protein